MPAKKKIAKPSTGPKVHVDSIEEPLVKFRLYQEEGFLNERFPYGADMLRILFYIMRRQAGKTHMLANIGLDWMMEGPGVDVIFISASLRLGTENIRKEAEVFRKVMGQLRTRASSADLKYTTSADDDKGRLLDVDAIADLFESQKLETKLHYSNTTFSRSLTIAPNPDTAVGHTGYLIFDEVGRMPEFKDMMEAATPFISSNPKLKMRGATTPPPDDAHFSYDLLAPSAGEEFRANPRGNYYLGASEEKFPVLRVDAWDAAAAGVPMYDLRSGKAITPEESRARSGDKTAWDRNYGCKFVRGGTSALSNLWLTTAQVAGTGAGVAIDVTEPITLKEAA